MIDARPSGSPSPTATVTLRPDDLLRELASAGRLVSAQELAPDVAASVRCAAYELAWPLVWSVHTRPLEARKGHRSCTRSATALADSCLDGFHDDVEAVVDYLFAYGRQEIGNLEGWVTSRITAATVDGNRRRRGLLGAQQRPRVPAWLATALRGDPWFVDLARLVIEWVGVRCTAGHHLWPVDAWGEVRFRITPERGYPDPTDVGRDVQHVLAVMRTERPRWYATYIEAPLGRKQAPLVAAGPDGPDAVPLALAAHHEREDAAMSELADAAIDAIRTGLAEGGEPRTVVERVLFTLFLGTDPASGEIADVPLARPPLDECVSAVLASDAAVTELVESVLAIVTDCATPGDERIVGAAG